MSVNMTRDEASKFAAGNAACSIRLFSRRRAAVLAILLFMLPLNWVLLCWWYHIAFLGNQRTDCVGRFDMWVLHRPTEALIPLAAAWMTSLLCGLSAFRRDFRASKGMGLLLCSLQLLAAGAWIVVQFWKYLAGCWGDHQPALALALALPPAGYMLKVLVVRRDSRVMPATGLAIASLNLALLSLVVPGEIGTFAAVLLPLATATAAMSYLVPFWRADSVKEQ